MGARKNELISANLKVRLGLDRAFSFGESIKGFWKISVI